MTPLNKYFWTLLYTLRILASFEYMAMEDLHSPYDDVSLRMRPGTTEQSSKEHWRPPSRQISPSTSRQATEVCAHMHSLCAHRHSLRASEPAHPLFLNGHYTLVIRGNASRRKM